MVKNICGKAYFAIQFLLKLLLITKKGDNMAISLNNSKVSKELKELKNFAEAEEAKLNNDEGGTKRFLSKVSGAFVLPIFIMAIAGLILGIGSTIVLHSGDNYTMKLSGQFISNIGNPVFAAMPLLFAAAIAVAFTEEAGAAVFATIIGYITFSMLQSPFIHEYATSTYTVWDKGSPIKLNSADITTGTFLWDHFIVAHNHNSELLWGDWVKGTLDGTITVTTTPADKLLLAKTLTTNGLTSQVFSSVVFNPTGNHEGYNILFKGIGRNPETLNNLVSNNLGIKSLRTSVFGGILVGGITAWMYNRFHTIKLPKIISFFGGKRFIPLVVPILMIPLALVFLAIWPYLAYSLSKFGETISNAPHGLDSLAFGFVERTLVPFGLQHTFDAPVWLTATGGDLGASIDKLGHFLQMPGNTKALVDRIFEPKSAAAIQHILDSGLKGDSYLWTEFSKLNINKLGFTQEATDLWAVAYPGEHVTSLPVFNMLAKTLDLNLGRFMQGKFPFMTMALPAAALAMVFAAPKGNKNMALGIVVPAAITSFTTGITEPIEFTFLFLAPWLFWGFHAVMAGLSFMLMNLLGAHIGVSLTGGMIDMVMNGIIPMAKGTDFWLSFVVGGFMAVTYFMVFYWSIMMFSLETPGRRYNSNQEDFWGRHKDLGDPQARAVIAAYGGWKNITGISNCTTRLRFDVKDAAKVSEVGLRAAGAVGIMKISNSHVQAMFGSEIERLHVAIKALPRGRKVVLRTTITSEPKKVTVKKVSTKKPVVKKVIVKKVSTKKPVVKKVTVKKVSTKKPVVKKVTVKKVSAKKPVAKKTTKTKK